MMHNSFRNSLKINKLLHLDQIHENSHFIYLFIRIIAKHCASNLDNIALHNNEAEHISKY